MEKEKKGQVGHLKGVGIHLPTPTRRGKERTQLIRQARMNAKLKRDDIIAYWDYYQTPILFPDSLYTDSSNLYPTCTGRPIDWLNIPSRPKVPSSVLKTERKNPICYPDTQTRTQKVLKACIQKPTILPSHALQHLTNRPVYREEIFNITDWNWKSPIQTIPVGKVMTRRRNMKEGQARRRVETKDFCIQTPAYIDTLLQYDPNIDIILDMNLRKPITTRVIAQKKAKLKAAKPKKSVGRPRVSPL